MSLLTPALLAGAALIALPIILHLVMRQEPQRLVFPAMRFLERRQATNQTRMRLQHWLLLALRCGAIALLATALARPVWQSGDEAEGAKTGLAAAVVLDNAPRMGYVQDNRTRLAAAQETAAWLIGQLPADAGVALLDRSGGSRRLGERDAALLRADHVEVTAAVRPFGDTVADAIRLVAQQEEARHEVYVFTDLTESAWNDAARIRITEALDSEPGTRVYLIDVGVPQPLNKGLAAVKLSSESPRAGQAVTISADLYCTATAGNQSSTVELWLSTGDRPPEKRSETILSEGETNQGSQRAEFNLAGLDEGVHQGFVRLLGSDPLAVDDVRHFTLAVEPARPLLVTAKSRSDALFVSEAIAPSAAGAAPRQPLEFLPFDQLSAARLDEFVGVMLLDPPGLEDNTWRRLADYARRGGSVAMFLGRNASRQTHNAAAPQSLLPGPLKRRSRAETYFRPAGYRHGALNQLAEFAELIPWSQFPVFESWEFETLAPAALVVAPLADDRPGLVERRLGEGRVLTMVTPLSDKTNQSPWNLLPTGDDPWPFVLLMGNLADYMAGAGKTRCNFTAGEPASVLVSPGAAAGGYVLRIPSGEATRQPAPVGQTEIIVGATEVVGNYRLQAGGTAGRLDTGFSVNAQADTGRLERIEFDTIAADLGAERVQLATSRQELILGVDQGRIGREFYPYLIVLVAMALAAEQWVANRFYRGT